MLQKRSPYLVNKAFNSFLLASLLTVAASQLGATVDGMMLSYLVGEDAMSCVNICRPVIQLLYALTMLIGAGSSMLVGVAIGNRDRTKANRIFSGVMVLCLVMSIIISVTAHIWQEPIVQFLCPDQELTELTTSFFIVTIWGAPVFMLSIMFEMFVTVDGSPKRVTASIIIATLANIVLDYLFIAIMQWGVTGAACATMASSGISFLLLLPHFIKKGSLRLTFTGIVPTIGKSVVEGLPFGLATALIAVQLWGNNCIVLKYLGNMGIVALSVCMYLMQISMIILSGTLKTFQPVASILKGAGDRSGVMMTIKRAYTFMAVCFVVFTLPLVLAPLQVAMVFGVSNAECLAVSAHAIPPFSVNILLMCMVYLLLPIYQLYGNRPMATFLSVCQSIAPTLGLWLFAVYCPAWVWWGFAFGQVVTVVCILFISAIVGWCKKNVCPVILVPRHDEYIGFETSIQPTFESMAEALTAARAFMHHHGISSDTAMHIELASEELVKNIITHGLNATPQKKRYIDYRLTLMADVVKLIVCDDARPFNPVDHKESNQLGLAIVNGICTELKYDYLFHQNMTTCTFARVSSSC